MTRTDVAIIGGGLSGLAAARMLAGAGREAVVFEARTRLGGRILSRDGFDLGPAWVWPHNRRMLALTHELGIGTFPQHATGRLVYEDARGTVRRDLDFSTMAGALRVAGGLATVIDALARQLAPRQLRLGHRVQSVTQGADGLILHGTAQDGPFEATANAVILALPPRLAATTLSLPIDDTEQAELAAIPTWMAGHAKLMAVYDTPFWRSAGLSGDAISQRGPLAEIHDASPAGDAAGALFGFLGWPAARRPAEATQAAARDQLARLFGPEAAHPSKFWFHDWAEEPCTATQADHAPLTAHPAYGALRATESLRAIGLHLAGSETADEDGGFLEGALAAAERAVQRASAASSRSSGKTGASTARSSANFG